MSMSPSPTTYDALEARVAAWIARQPDMRAALVLGSRARTDTPSDAYSDLDLLLLAEEPNRYLDDAGWVAEIGRLRVTFVEETATGSGRERRVLFDGGLDVDFSIFPVALFADLAPALEHIAASADIPTAASEDERRALELAHALRDVTRRGIRILADKDGLLARALPLLDRLPAADASPLPTTHDFAETANDFWYHAVWTAKKLRRGELWVAKSCCDSYMKALLLRVLAWHARAVRGVADTWHGGRFVERWADPAALAALRDTYARYDAADVKLALFATMDLFRRLATETASALDCAYPSDADEYATALVREILDAGKPGADSARVAPE
jgi:aminoglycoside 6-adenylyltransferase